MDEKEFKNSIPCIVDNGIIYNPKDIQRVLRDLGQVNYFYLIDNETKSTGEAYVVSVLSNNYSANIIANKRIYLNVTGFEYMSLKTEDNQTKIDLIDQNRIIRLIPVMTDELQGGDIIISHSSDYLSESYDDEELAEINGDDDYDEE
ncbi:MAG: hypothetical protein H7263_00220 [Candidatus Sericytochromatia bacterium]|nr:hypothetical protein [Candidatus Sericytochromatia bacterium]